jgi:hypothetical protein
VAPRLVLRLDAICDAALAVFLLAATWNGLYDFLGLPLPQPPFYAQLLGVALLALAVVEWGIAGLPGQREVAVGVSFGSAAGALVLAVWLIRGDTGAEHRGVVILGFVAAFLALEAVLHARTWIKNVGP